MSVQIPEAFKVLDEVSQDAVSPGDQEAAEQLRSELTAERNKALSDLGSHAIDIEQVNVNGYIVPVNVVHTEIAQGRALSEAHIGGYKA